MSIKRYTCASFPVLLNDMGVEKTIAEVKNCGFDHFFTCCGIYSPYRLVMPRNTKRGIYSLEEGMQYYYPNEKYYHGTKIKPAASKDFGKIDILGETIKYARQYGLTVGAWLPIFSNGRIAKTYTDTAIENLYGSKDRMYLCYNNPDVLTFSKAMIQEMVQEYNVDVVELDKIPQTNLELNAFAGRIDPILRFIGSFCFCEHCQKEAKELGFDLNAIKKHATKLASQCLTIAPSVVNGLGAELQGDAEIPLLLFDEPLMLDLIRLRMLTTRNIIRDFDSEIKNMNKNTKLSVTFVPPFKIGHDAASPRSWLGGQSYKNVADIVDIINSVIHWENDVVAYETKRASYSVEGKCMLDVHIPAYGRFSPEQTIELASTAAQNGADALSFFCWDLMSDDMVKHINSYIKENKSL